jgi:RNA polymerase sigma-70 factor (ECF subfamily)
MASTAPKAEIQPMVSELEALKYGEDEHTKTEAFAAIYRAYYHNIKDYIHSYTHSDPDAEDLTQEVFIKMINNIHSFESNGTPLFSWLTTLARNAVIDRLRSEAVRPITHSTPFLEEMDSRANRSRSKVDDPAQIVIDRDECTTTLQILNPNQRQFLFDFSLGYSYEEIATLRGVSTAKVNSAIHRARAKINKAGLFEISKVDAIAPNNKARAIGKVAMPPPEELAA